MNLAKLGIQKIGTGKLVLVEVVVLLRRSPPSSEIRSGGSIGALDAMEDGGVSQHDEIMVTNTG